MVLTKVLFWIFEILSFGFFMIFFFALTWDPMGAKTAKRYSPHKPLLDFSKVFLNCLLSIPHKSTVLEFGDLELTIFNDFVLANLKFGMVPYG